MMTATHSAIMRIRFFVVGFMDVDDLLALDYLVALPPYLAAVVTAIIISS
ncbi:hypothetical protein PA598K_05208 [Paenibacillus sp. 598K]|nr:hypothetical protein PA598K_05208 [Paenibacillus sp. 598K]